MRTIKFRGKTVNGNEWIFGTTISQGTIKRKADKWFMEVGENKWKGLQPGSLGQFTGLFDKNGKEIYEGDIIEYTHEVCLEDGPGTFNGVVCFRCGVFCIEEDEGSPLWQLECESEDYGGICVIGNIHDNPELLTNK